MIDVFRIGVSIGMTNDVSPVIATIQRDLAVLGGSIDRAIARFGALRLAAMGAMGGVGLGQAGLGGTGLGGAGMALAGYGRDGRGGKAPDTTAPLAATIEAASRTMRDAAARFMPGVGVGARAGGTGGLVAGPANSLLFRHDMTPFATGVVIGDPRVAVDLSPATALARRLAHGGAAARASDVTAAGQTRPAPAGDIAAWTMVVARQAGTSPVRPLTVAPPGAGGGVVAASAELAAASRWVTALARGLGEWSREARAAIREAATATSELRSATAGLALRSLFLGRADRSRAFERVARGRWAMARTGHGIADWGMPRVAAGTEMTGSETGSVLHVHVVNAREIGNATGDAVNRGLRAPAAVAPSLPAPATMPWAPGLMPAIP